MLSYIPPVEQVRKQARQKFQEATNWCNVEIVSRSQHVHGDVVHSQFLFHISVTHFFYCKRKLLVDRWGSVGPWRALRDLQQQILRNPWLVHLIFDSFKRLGFPRVDRAWITTCCYSDHLFSSEIIIVHTALVVRSSSLFEFKSQRRMIMQEEQCSRVGGYWAWHSSAPFLHRVTAILLFSDEFTADFTAGRTTFASGSFVRWPALYKA